MTCPSDTDTVLIDISLWNPPVDAVDDLASGAPDGQLCFVKAEDQTFVVRNQSWRPVESEVRI